MDSGKVVVTRSMPEVETATRSKAGQLDWGSKSANSGSVGHPVRAVSSAGSSCRSPSRSRQTLTEARTTTDQSSAWVQIGTEPGPKSLHAGLRSTERLDLRRVDTVETTSRPERPRDRGAEAHCSRQDQSRDRDPNSSSASAQSIVTLAISSTSSVYAPAQPLPRTASSTTSLTLASSDA